MVVYDRHIYGAGDYKISLHNLQGCSWPSLSCGHTVSSSIDEPSEMDVYEFEGQVGERVLIDAEAITGTLDMHMMLFPPDGTGYVASGEDYLNHRLTQSGT